MSDIDDLLAKSRELQQWYQDTYGSPEKTDEQPTHIADSKGNCHRLPPKGMSARQKLDWANTHGAPHARKAEPPVTLDEIGISPAELARLRPEQRLARANEAMARRKKG